MSQTYVKFACLQTNIYLGRPRVAPNLLGSARLWSACLNRVLPAADFTKVVRNLRHVVKFRAIGCWASIRDSYARYGAEGIP